MTSIRVAVPDLIIVNLPRRFINSLPHFLLNHLIYVQIAIQALIRAKPFSKSADSIRPQKLLVTLGITLASNHICRSKQKNAPIRAKRLPMQLNRLSLRHEFKTLPAGLFRPNSLNLCLGADGAWCLLLCYFCLKLDMRLVLAAPLMQCLLKRFMGFFLIILGVLLGFSLL